MAAERLETSDPGSLKNNVKDIRVCYADEWPDLNLHLLSGSFKGD